MIYIERIWTFGSADARYLYGITCDSEPPVSQLVCVHVIGQFPLPANASQYHVHNENIHVIDSDFCDCKETKCIMPEAAGNMQPWWCVRTSIASMREQETGSTLKNRQTSPMQDKILHTERNKSEVKKKKTAERIEKKRISKYAWIYVWLGSAWHMQKSSKAEI